MSNYLTYFDNKYNPGSKIIHRVTTGETSAVCGVPMKDDAKQIPKNVTCDRCKDTWAYKRGSH